MIIDSIVYIGNIIIIYSLRHKVQYRMVNKHFHLIYASFAIYFLAFFHLKCILNNSLSKNMLYLQILLLYISEMCVHSEVAWKYQKEIVNIRNESVSIKFTQLSVKKAAIIFVCFFMSLELKSRAGRGGDSPRLVVRVLSRARRCTSSVSHYTDIWLQYSVILAASCVCDEQITPVHPSAIISQESNMELHGF